MNISTSSQVCYPVLSSGFFPPRFETPTAVSYFPFFNEQFLAVAASLNGGNSLSAFVKMLQTWFSTFGMLSGLLYPHQHSCEGGILECGEGLITLVITLVFICISERQCAV